MNPNCQAAVVIPCLNEADRITASMDHMQTAAGQLPSGTVEIIYVDNGSTDGTPDLIAERSRDAENMTLLCQPVPGEGHARTLGVRHALRQAGESVGSDRPFWMLSCDADVTVPSSWFSDWLEDGQSGRHDMYSGRSRFEPEFYDRYPVAAAIMRASAERIRPALGLFKAINFDANNGAYERRVFEACGPFITRHLVQADGRVVQAAGVDYDFGLRARRHGFSIGGATGEPAVISARRAENDIRAFVDGTNYDAEFKRVEAAAGGCDIRPDEIDHMQAASFDGLVKLMVSKSILIFPELLSDGQVRHFLGAALLTEIQDWTARTPAVNFFEERQAFMTDYLPGFHARFGTPLASRFAPADLAISLQRSIQDPVNIYSNRHIASAGVN